MNMAKFKSLAEIVLVLIIAVAMCLSISLLMCSWLADTSVRGLFIQGLEWLGASHERKLIVLLLPGSILGWVWVFTILHRHLQSASSATQAQGAESSADVK